MILIILDWVLKIIAIIMLICFWRQARKYKMLYEGGKEEFKRMVSVYVSEQKRLAEASNIVAHELQVENMKLIKERDEMKQKVIAKILKMLGPLIEEKAIEIITEMGANQRARRLSQGVIQKFKKELGVE